jgi:hypothetical protein
MFKEQIIQEKYTIKAVELFIEILSTEITNEFKFIIDSVIGKKKLEESAKEFLETCNWNGNPTTSTNCGLLDAYIYYKTNKKYTLGKYYAKYLSNRGGIITNVFEIKKYYPEDDNNFKYDMLTMIETISIIDGNNLFCEWLERGAL